MIVSNWPKGKTIVLKEINEVKLISSDKILENNKTVSQCKTPFGEVAGGVTVMHVIVHLLEGKYKDWQKKLHPDVVHNKSQKERDYTAEQFAKVIEACRTLTKRLSRAMYIMKLNGKSINEEEIVTDPTLLTKMMELREVITEVDDSKGLKQIQSQGVKALCSVLVAVAKKAAKTLTGQRETSLASSAQENSQDGNHADKSGSEGSNSYAF